MFICNCRSEKRWADFSSLRRLWFVHPLQWICVIGMLTVFKQRSLVNSFIPFSRLLATSSVAVFVACALEMMEANEAAPASGSTFLWFHAAVHFLRRGSAGVESELRELRVLHRDLKNKKKELALRLKQKRQRDARLMAKVQFLVLPVGERCGFELSVRVHRRPERYPRSNCRGS